MKLKNTVHASPTNVLRLMQVALNSPRRGWRAFFIPNLRSQYRSEVMTYVSFAIVLTAE